MESSYLLRNFTYLELLLWNVILMRTLGGLCRAPICVYWLCQSYYGATKLYECRVRLLTINGYRPCVWTNGYTKRESGEESHFDEGRIEFKDVSFEYTPGVPVKEALNFTVEPGQPVAFVSTRVQKIFHYEFALSDLWPNEWWDLDWWQKHAWWRSVRSKSCYKIRIYLQWRLLQCRGLIMNRFN